ncbi:MAG: ABC transporter ATP-binding protein [Gammaproteobacteria bacterium]|nr:ABC transporter ATP-binding protein [Gammaproteobacteria bacterium]
MPDAHVEFRNVSKTFDGETYVAQDINLQVPRGEFLTLLGPSGSGKTTCLMMLAGFEAPSSGEILVDGVPVHDTPPHRRAYGIVFQNYALFPHMSVEKNLAFPLQVRGVEKARQQEQVARVLELVQLQGFGARRPTQLSGGQQQRIAIARALVYEPELVLMDEPLGALDRQLREEMQYEIRRIQDAVGVTMLYVTHDQGEAMVMSDRIAVFEAGRIKQLAAPITLYEEPNDPFVASFIGENNRLAGVVQTVEDDICIVDVKGHTVHAAQVSKTTQAGDDVLVVLRPERISVQPRNHDYSNVHRAKVVDLTFVGDHLRVLLHACGNESLIAKIPNTAGHGSVLEGDHINIGWATLDCRAIPI